MKSDEIDDNIKDDNRLYDRNWGDSFFKESFNGNSNIYCNDYDESSKDFSGELNLGIHNYDEELGFPNNIKEEVEAAFDSIQDDILPISNQESLTASNNLIKIQQESHLIKNSFTKTSPKQESIKPVYQKTTECAVIPTRAITTVTPNVLNAPKPTPISSQITSNVAETNTVMELTTIYIEGICIVVVNLYHSFICTIGKQCTFPNCFNYKSVITHMNQCTSDQCNIERCVHIRQIICHFCMCSKQNCSICSFLIPILDSIKLLSETETKKYNALTYTYMNDDSLFEKFSKAYDMVIENRCRLNLQPTLQNNSIKNINNIRFYRPPHNDQPKNMHLFNEHPTNIIINSLPQNMSNTPSNQLHITDKNLNKVNPLLISKCDVSTQKVPTINYKNETPNHYLINAAAQNYSDTNNKNVNIDDLDNIKEKPWDAHKLNGIFTAIIQKLTSIPESYYFREPVDHVKLNIPDYPELIREPMDFTTIKSKLNKGVYTSPWAVVYDIQLIFDNAFLYNKKNTKVHKSALKIYNIFQPIINDFMTKVGYCCAKRLIYSQQVLYCYSKDYCVIPCNAYYFRYDDKTYYCTNCFNDMKNDIISVTREGSSTPRQIPRNEFKRVRNNEICYEPFVICVQCRSKFHKICVRHVDIINGKYYYCDACLNSLKIPKTINHFTSKNLPHTNLSIFIENRINSILKAEFSSCHYVNIRVICNVDKTVETKPRMLQKYKHVFPPSFPFRTKAIFAFQLLDGCDEVCFYSMHTQEYGPNCPEPNKKRVYISYIDSVHYFQPKHLRTLLYHEIILSYLLFCKSLGYLFCHIWSCPPCEGDDYVFHCHSFEQKLPKARRLLEWYFKMIELGTQKKIIMEHYDICKYFSSVQGDLAPLIPYFDGDYWSNSLDDIIMEYEKDTANNNNIPAIKKTIDKVKVKQGGAGGGGNVDKKAKYRSNSISKKGSSDIPITLNSRILALMERYREVFFVLRLNDDNFTFKNEIDPVMQSDLMDGRSGFLTMARENHWEFSSLRHAIYSTKAVLYIVHQQMWNFVEFTCDKCRAALFEGYHCTLCDSDYDLCKLCYAKYGHEHKMEEKTYITFKSDAKQMTQHNGNNNANLSSSLHCDLNNSMSRRQSEQYKEIISILLHAVECSSTTCNVPQCPGFKKTMCHFEHCNFNNRTYCNTCKQLYQVYLYHASSCNKSNCKVPLCSRLQNLTHNNRAVADMKTRSRIMNMNMNMDEVIKPERSSNDKSSRKIITKGVKVENDSMITDNSQGEEEEKTKSNKVETNQHSISTHGIMEAQPDSLFPNHYTSLIHKNLIPSPVDDESFIMNDNNPYQDQIMLDNVKTKKNSPQSIIINQAHTPISLSQPIIQPNIQPIINNSSIIVGHPASTSFPLFDHPQTANMNMINNNYRGMQNVRMPTGYNNQGLPRNMMSNLPNNISNVQNLPRVINNQVFANPARNISYNQMQNTYSALGVDNTVVNMPERIPAEYINHQPSGNNQMPIIQNINGVSFLPNGQGIRMMPYGQPNNNSNNNFTTILSPAQYNQLRQSLNASSNSSINTQYLNPEQQIQLQNLLRSQNLNNNNSMHNVNNMVNVGYNPQQSSIRYNIRTPINSNHHNQGFTNSQQLPPQYVVQPGNTTILPGNLIQNTPINQIQGNNLSTGAISLNNIHFPRNQMRDGTYVQDGMNNQLLNAILNSQMQQNIQINHESHNPTPILANQVTSPNLMASSASRSRQCGSVNGINNVADAQLANNNHNTTSYKIIDSRVYNSAPITLQNNPYFTSDRNHNYIINMNNNNNSSLSNHPLPQSNNQMNNFPMNVVFQPTNNNNNNMYQNPNISSSNNTNNIYNNKDIMNILITTTANK